VERIWRGWVIAALAAAIAICGSLGAALAADILAVKCDIVVIGKIEPSDDATFRHQLVGHLIAGCPSPRIYLYSPGGDFDVAIRIGEQIYSLQLATVGPNLRARVLLDEPDVRNRSGSRVCEMLPGSADRARREGQIAAEYSEAVVRAYKNRAPVPPSPPAYGDFDPASGKGDPRCTCGSACFVIWAAGSERKGDVIEIHRPYFNPEVFARLDAGTARAAYQRLADDARSYLNKVGIPGSIIDRMMNVDSKSASYLSAQELGQLSMAPHWQEMKLARCGPEPKLEVMTEEQARDEELAEMLQGRAPSPRYAQLPWPRRKRLIALLEREACWREAQKELRAAAIDEYLKTSSR
jgi:hypothetical protein